MDVDLKHSRFYVFKNSLKESETFEPIENSICCLQFIMQSTPTIKTKTICQTFYFFPSLFKDINQSDFHEKTILIIPFQSPLINIFGINKNFAYNVIKAKLTSIQF